MSQINLHEIIYQQQEQLEAMQVQIQALLAVTRGAGSIERGVTGSNMGPHCYESMLKGLSKEATLVLSNIRELNRVPSTE